jgi:DNA-binding transcriptional regulator PaaX
MLLRDPLLPGKLLPGDWEGHSAEQLCRNLYLAVYARSDDFLAYNLENASGPLPVSGAGFYRRFFGEGVRALKIKLYTLVFGAIMFAQDVTVGSTQKAQKLRQ